MTQILISSSILILVLVLLRKALRGKVSFRLQYALWLLVALRLLVPVQIGHSAYSVTSMSRPQTQAAERFLERPLMQTQSARPVQKPAENAAPVQKPVEQFTPAQKPVEQTTPVQKPVEQTTPVSPSATVQQPTKPVTQEPEQTMTVGQVLKVVWLCGIGCMAIWFFAVNCAFRRKARKNAQWIPVEDYSLPVYLTSHIPSACLVGLVHPRVYLTEESARNDRTMGHVLTHERMHYRHGDHIWALVRAVCLCIYWFDPLVWWAASLSRQDGELACDEGALRQLGEDERIPYGKTLVGMIAEAGRADRLLQTATTMKATKKQMKERIQMIAKKPRRLIAALICLLLIVAITVGCTFAGGEPSKPDTSTEPPKESTPTEPTSPTEPQEGLVAEYYRSADGSFRIPQIDLESQDAKYDNERILETFGKNETTSDYSQVDYTWAVNKQCLSLVVRGVRKDTGKTERLIYNLDSNSGTELTKEQLHTRALGVASAQYQQMDALSLTFARELRDILMNGEITDFQLSPEQKKELEDALQVSLDPMPTDVAQGLVIDAFQQTIYPANLDEARPWMDENGNLWCCMTIYPPQGGMEERELCLTRTAVPEPYDDSVTPKVVELYSNGNLRIPFLLMTGKAANDINGRILRTLLREDVTSADYSWEIDGDVLRLTITGKGTEDIRRTETISLVDGAQGAPSNSLLASDFMLATGFADVLTSLEANESSRERTCGRLYDVDADGQEELLVYYIPPGTYSPMVCEIWDATDDQPQRIFQGEWGGLAGGIHLMGELYLVRAEGETYLLNYHYVTESDNILSEYWDYYLPSADGYKLAHACYAYHVTDRKTMEKTWTYQIDGQEVSEAEFMADPIHNSEDTTLILCCHVMGEDRRVEDGIPWSALLLAGGRANGLVASEYMKSTGYANVLTGYMSDPDDGDFRGRLYDVDADGQEELIIYHIGFQSYTYCEIWDTDGSEAWLSYRGVWRDKEERPRGTWTNRAIDLPGMGELFLMQVGGETYLLNHYEQAVADNAVEKRWEYHLLTGDTFVRKRSYRAEGYFDYRTGEIRWVYKLDGETVSEEEFKNAPFWSAQNATLIFSGNTEEKDMTVADGIPWSELLFTEE